jgi:peroxiredoxin
MSEIDPGLSVGTAVVHLFCKPGPTVDHEAVRAAAAAAEADGMTVISIAIMGHKADLAFMLLGPDLWRHRKFQTAIQSAGLAVVESFISITEVSEYAKSLPEEMLQDRLYPNLPPEGKNAWSFYPMSKRRGESENWFTLDFDTRKNMMYEHGTSGRKFAGRVVQLITASTGLDEYEWGVTLFCQHLDDLKDIVYTMRFDEASAKYGDFGPFYTGIVAPQDDVLGQTIA